MNTKILQEWGKVLPKLIMSKSDDEFDKIWSDYLKKRDELGFAKVQEYKQKKYEENLKKLAEFIE
ncbi:hypothetical protein D3C77_614220 [compost metagenome]